MKYMRSKKLNFVPSLSGGKDSTAMLHMMVERGIEIHSAVFFDTGWEFPQMLDHIEQVKRNLPQINIVTIKANRPFSYWLLDREVKTKFIKTVKTGEAKPPLREDYLDDFEFEDELDRWRADPFEYKTFDVGDVNRRGNGWPSPNRRWCTREKVNAINRYLRGIENPVSCIGFALDERHRHKENNGKIRKVYPLIEYGVTEKEALSYCYSLGYRWGGLYDIFRRVSCFCCPLQRMGELRKVRHHFPDLWGKMLEWEKAGGPETFRGFKKYISVYGLEQRFKKEDAQLTMWSRAQKKLR